MLSLDGFTGQAEQALHSASPGLLPARTPQEPERHPGVRPNSASGPLHPEAPLRRQQALCTKTRRISKLVLGATSCSPRKGRWLPAGRTLLDKHEAQDAATPDWPKPEPVSHSALRAAHGRLHPRRQPSQHRHEGRKGKRKGPRPRCQVRAHRPPLCCPPAVGADITNQSRSLPTEHSLESLHSPFRSAAAISQSWRMRESHFPHLPSQPRISDTRAASHLWAHSCLMS